MSKDVVRTKTRDVVLESPVLYSPVDVSAAKTRRRTFWIVVLLAVAIIAILLIRRFTTDRPVDYRAEVDHFKYGSIGSEPGGSIRMAIGGLLPPYEIFKVLPQVCPDKLPGGYASLGLIFEKGHDLPIGVSRRRRLGLDQVGLNCAVCHTGTVRESRNDTAMIVPGMPAHQLNLQNLFRFVLDCSLDERFTPDNVLARMQEGGANLSWFDRAAYKYTVIPRTREATLQLSQRLALLMGDKVTEWGSGRVDTFNPYKGLQFNWQLSRLPIEELTGASDFPSLWNQRPRAGMQLHWDGNNDSVDERNLSASLGTGVTPVTVDHARLARLRQWIWTEPPPAYPFQIDRTRAGQGRELYRVHCQECHADERFKEATDFKAAQAMGSRIGTVVPIQAIGTDPYRLNSYTYEFASNQYTLYPHSPYRFRHFRKTQGYANQPLDGIWARAPYLHNGSVPTLRALLDAPETRPKQFYRGYDVFDKVRVGFVYDVPEENGRAFFAFDTARPGNGNQGHVYGTNLSPAEKDAIVEFMKMF
jgi:hypothetical protein